MIAIDIIKILKRVDCFPNTSIVYRIILTIHIIVASIEISFSKLKIWKSYLRSIMIQKQLVGSDLITIENNLSEKVIYEDIIKKIISTSIRMIVLFK